MRASRTSDLELSSAVALIGPPNAGKTTLYNWLTGSKSKTVNYPGSTVEFSLGALAPHLGTASFQWMDTPGTYSLNPKSQDEWVTLKSLYENPKVQKIRGVVVVIDGTQLQRHLPLALQISETGFPMVVVVTMVDLLRKEDVHLDFNFLSSKLRCPVIPFEGLLAGGLQKIVAQCQEFPPTSDVRTPQAWSFSDLQAKIKLADEWAQEALKLRTEATGRKLSNIVASTEKLDRVLLHPILGFAFFILIMTFLFSSVYWLAMPFMDAIDGAFTSVNASISQALPESLFASFISDGVVTSFAAFLVFVPQIFILFFGIGILESSGYLARAATLIDRPFAKLGMSGRSFVPLLSAFACAVPAIIATRNIPSKKDRWITAFVIPLMSCSARLPVYALCLMFLFKDKPAWHAGLALAFLYIASLFVGAIAAGVVNRFLPEKEGSFFMMELPLYRRPRFQIILRQSWSRTFSYIKRAGPVIFIFAILIWFGTTFPNYQAAEPQQVLESSYVGKLGQVIEPVVQPMGLDWKAGVGLISAFAAREVFVSSMAVTYSLTSDDEGQLQEGLLDKMSQATHADGSRVFTISSVLGLMVFFLIALQCMSTVAVQAREMNSWPFALTQLVAFNVLAYVVVVVLVQGLRFIGIS